METLLYLNPWDASYSYVVSPSQGRTQGGIGYTRQASRGHRQSNIATVTRRLMLTELSYFEYFIREVVNAGKYIDAYQDQNGLQSGPVRIVDGRYTVETDLRFHTVSCELEIFR